MRMFMGQDENVEEIPPHVAAYRAAAAEAQEKFVQSQGVEPAPATQSEMQKLIVPLGVALAAFLLIKG